MEQIARDRDLEVPMLRWPGGALYRMESALGLHELQETSSPSNIGRMGLVLSRSDRRALSLLGSPPRATSGPNEAQ